MAGGAEVTAAAVLDGLEGAPLNVRRRRLDARRIGRSGDNRLDEEFVVETFLFEIAFFLGDPLLETPMRLNPEFSHNRAPVTLSSNERID
jgi:hypothetical protein